jgi:hypothetical protein
MPPNRGKGRAVPGAVAPLAEDRLAVRAAEPGGEEEGPLSQGGSTGQGKGRLGSTGPLYSHARAPLGSLRGWEGLYIQHTRCTSIKEAQPPGGSSDRP